MAGADSAHPGGSRREQATGVTQQPSDHTYTVLQDVTWGVGGQQHTPRNWAGTHSEATAFPDGHKAASQETNGDAVPL